MFSTNRKIGQVARGRSPYHPATVHNFYAYIWNERGADDLWVMLSHYLFQCHVRMEFAGWFTGEPPIELGRRIGIYKNSTGFPVKLLKFSTANKYVNGKRMYELFIVLEWAFHNHYLPWAGNELCCDRLSMVYFNKELVPAMRADVVANGKLINRSAYTRRYEVPEVLVGGPSLRLRSYKGPSHEVDIFGPGPSPRRRAQLDADPRKRRYLVESGGIHRRLVTKKRQRLGVFSRLA